MTATKSFVIPVYRNERAVTITYQKIRAMLPADLPRYDYELVFVDDGSDDGSLEELLAIRKRRRPRVRVVSFTRNFGQMAAILAGLKQAAGDRRAARCPPTCRIRSALIPRMVQQFEAGNEVVMPTASSARTAVARGFRRGCFYGIVRLSFPQIPPGGFDYILIDRKVVDAFNSVEVRNRFFQGDILWFGYRTAFMPYTRSKRTIGRSQYTFAKRLKNSLDAILDSSYLPIRFISLVGVLTALRRIPLRHRHRLCASACTTSRHRLGADHDPGAGHRRRADADARHHRRVRLAHLRRSERQAELRRPPHLLSSAGAFAEIDGFRCYAPELARAHTDYPAKASPSPRQSRHGASGAVRATGCCATSSSASRIARRYEMLEIGCGIGGVVGELRRFPHLTLTASEIYLEGLRFARSRFPDVDFIQLDATTMPSRPLSTSSARSMYSSILTTMPG